MRTQHDSILNNSDELQEWDEANKEALADAAKDAFKLTLGRLAKILQGKQQALRGLQDRIIKNMYRRGSTVNPEYAANIARELQAANRAYDMAKSQVDLGNVLQAGMDAKDIWEMVNKTISAVANAQANADAVVKAAVTDPQLSYLVRYRRRSRRIPPEVRRNGHGSGSNLTTRRRRVFRCGYCV